MGICSNVSARLVCMSSIAIRLDKNYLKIHWGAQRQVVMTLTGKNPNNVNKFIVILCMPTYTDIHTLCVHTYIYVVRGSFVFGSAFVCLFWKMKLLRPPSVRSACAAQLRNIFFMTYDFLLEARKHGANVLKHMYYVCTIDIERWDSHSMAVGRWPRNSDINIEYEL